MNGIQSVIDHLKQYDTNNILSLFPQPVYNTVVNCSDEEMRILKQQELYPVGNGSVSKDNHILDLTPKLKGLISEQANSFLVQLGFDFDVMITTSWINHHKQGEWCQDHMHTNSMLSGVLFLDIPPYSLGYPYLSVSSKLQKLVYLTQWCAGNHPFSRLLASGRT